MAGLLALVGGVEFEPGNEPQDREMVAAARRGPAYVLPTAQARSGPAKAVAHAQRWFASLGLEVLELPVTTRAHARSPELVEKAAAGGFFYLVGGDPGQVAAVLRGSPVWEAMVAAWRSGAVLAGSSAGSMALCEWTLVIDRWPHHDERKYKEALNVVPNSVVLPHFDAFGERWIPSATAAAPAPGVTLIGVNERCAAVHDANGWRAVGRVVVIRDGERGEYESGAGLPIPEPLTQA